MEEVFDVLYSFWVVVAVGEVPGEVVDVSVAGYYGVGSCSEFVEFFACWELGFVYAAASVSACVSAYASDVGLDVCEGLVGGV